MIERLINGLLGFYALGLLVPRFVLGWGLGMAVANAAIYLGLNRLPGGSVSGRRHRVSSMATLLLPLITVPMIFAVMPANPSPGDPFPGGLLEFLLRYGWKVIVASCIIRLPFLLASAAALRRIRVGCCGVVLAGLLEPGLSLVFMSVLYPSYR